MDVNDLGGDSRARSAIGIAAEDHVAIHHAFKAPDGKLYHAGWVRLKELILPIVQL